MIFVDLTKADYGQLFSIASCEKWEDRIRWIWMRCAPYTFQEIFCGKYHDAAFLLSDMPVFILESSMAGGSVEVPGLKIKIPVPQCEPHSDVERAPYLEQECEPRAEPERDWIFDNQRRGRGDSPVRTAARQTIVDPLGVYVYAGESSPVPRRIFIWADRIQKIAKGRSSLFDLVLYHEIAHALMDVPLYNVTPDPDFRYSNPIYKFNEEAFANAFAYNAVKDSLSDQDDRFIRKFIKQQPSGYNSALEIMDFPFIDYGQWMSVKVLYSRYFIPFFQEHRKFLSLGDLLRSLLGGVRRPKEHHGFLGERKVVRPIGYPGRLVVKRDDGKWVVVDSLSLDMVDGFKPYDYIWRYHDGLCEVGQVTKSCSRHGYIDENGVERIPLEYESISSFNGGLAVAKKDGRYGIIDMDNNVVVPFGLPYATVLGFRDGRARVKGYNGKWGVIDTSGNLIEPCDQD